MIEAGGTARRLKPGGTHRRGDGRQHRPRPRAGRRAEGLPADPGAARQDEPGEDLQPARDGRGSRADALGRRARAIRSITRTWRARIARDARRVLHQPVRQSRQSARRTRRRPAPEIWEQMEHKLDAVVVRRRLERHDRRARRVLQQASRRTSRWCSPIRQGSVLAEYIAHRQDDAEGLVAGRGHRRGFHSGDLRLLADQARLQHPGCRGVRRRRASCCRRKAILAGSSTGTLLAAALRYCREQTTPKRVVTFACDTGSKYLSKLYNDYWMEDQGFIEREQYGDLRDLIGAAARRARDGHGRAGRHRCRPRTTACATPASRSCRCMDGRAADRHHHRGRHPALRVRPPERFKEPVRNAMTRRCCASTRRCRSTAWSRCWKSVPSAAVDRTATNSSA